MFGKKKEKNCSNCSNDLNGAKDCHNEKACSNQTDKTEKACSSEKNSCGKRGGGKRSSNCDTKNCK